jgi:hypothetical protein
MLTSSFRKYTQNLKLEDIIMKNDWFLQKEIASPIPGETLLIGCTIIQSCAKSKQII